MSDYIDAAAKAAINAYFGEDCWDSLPEGTFDRWVAAIKYAVTPPPMAPDIREKAERLATGLLGSAMNSNFAIALISQALLEAHNAGRAEAAEWLETRAMQANSAARSAGERGDLTVCAMHLAQANGFTEAATAIRSIT